MSARPIFTPTALVAPLESTGESFIVKGRPTWSAWVVLTNGVPSLGTTFRIANSRNSKLTRLFGSFRLLIAGKFGLPLPTCTTGGRAIPKTIRVDTIRALGEFPTLKFVVAPVGDEAEKSRKVDTVAGRVPVIETNCSGFVKSFLPAVCRGTR